MVSSMVMQLLHSIKYSVELPFSNIAQQPAEIQKLTSTKKVNIDSNTLSQSGMKNCVRTFCWKFWLRKDLLFHGRGSKFLFETLSCLLKKSVV